MERTSKRSQERMNKLLDLMRDDDYYVGDFMLCVCANLMNRKEDSYSTSLRIGDKIFEININRRGLQ